MGSKHNIIYYVFNYTYALASLRGGLLPPSLFPVFYKKNIFLF